MQRLFFQQWQDIAKTHPYIIEWFDDTTDKEVKKDIIENCFKKVGLGKGKLTLYLDNPYFKECQQRCVDTLEAYMEL